jgi:adenosine deaminase
MDDATLPLIDLHRHLDGNVRLTTILDLGRRHNLPLPAWDLEGLRPHVQVTAAPTGGRSLPGVMAFIAKFQWMTEILVDYDACRRVAYENVEDALREGLRYVELRFSPLFMAEPHGLDLEGVVEAVADGIEAGTRDFGIKAKLIGIISRTYGVDAAWQELDALLRHRTRLVALDLAGDEANWPGELFVQHFRRARDAGLQVTVHAGEAAGPESVWQAIRDLGATRIGHAVAAIEDPSLLEAMAAHDVGIESCLTSNVQTATVPDYASHPLRRFLERGLLATLNTDDPGISAIDLPHELEIAAPAAGLTPEQIHQAQLNALAIAFLSVEETSLLLRSEGSSGNKDRGRHGAVPAGSELPE